MGKEHHLISKVKAHEPCYVIILHDLSISATLRSNFHKWFYNRNLLNYLVLYSAPFSSCFNITPTPNTMKSGSNEMLCIKLSGSQSCGLPKSKMPDAPNTEEWASSQNPKQCNA
jgi:hypothetical protein